jgi:hypothetical protein
VLDGIKTEFVNFDALLSFRASESQVVVITIIVFVGQWQFLG